MDIISKLQEALTAIVLKRKDLDESEAGLRAMIEKLSETAAPQSERVSFQLKPPRTSIRNERDRIDEVADILREIGVPLHITDIAMKLSEVTGKLVERKSIEPGMNRHVAKAKHLRIIKKGPSIFGLPEWNGASAKAHELEPQ